MSTMQVEVFQRETDGRDYLKMICAVLSRRLQAMQDRNPQGYLDAFESREGLEAMEVAQELGGRVEQGQDEVYRIRFGC